MQPTAAGIFSPAPAAGSPSHEIGKHTMDSTEVTTDGGLIKCGKGTLEKRNGIYIAQLEGSYEEIGYQHGRLAAEVCGDLVGSYFYETIEMLIRHSVPAFAGPAGRFLKSLFLGLNRKRVGKNMQALIRGFSDALGLPRSRTEKILFVPDIIHFLLGKAFPQFAPAPPSCSGFMARDSATAGGRLLVGRNFDFFGQGVWDPNNALIFVRPDGGQKYCWIGALGVPGSGQGMNESGIIISLHTKFQRDVHLTGTPLFVILTGILEKCENLDHAIRELTSRPRMCGLSLFVVDSRNRDAAVIGFSSNNYEVVRPEKDVLVRCNHYVTGEMKKLEIDVYQWMLHTKSRFNRIHEMIEEKRGALAPEDIPAIMADCTDYWEKRKRLAGCIVGATNNAQSVALSPDEDSMWLGNGPFPVCFSERFEGFRISALFSGDRNNYEIDPLPGGDPLDATEKAARGHYQAAWTAHLEDFRDDLSIFHLRKAAELAPGEPVYPRLAGFLLLKNERYEQALPMFEKNAAYDYRSELMRAEALLWLGRCLDLLGRRDEAVARYREAAALDQHPVSRAAARNVNSPFRPGQLSGISPEFVVGTVLAKY